ncbi:MAG: hypothetical protein KIS92_01760 [Planctomycetota bacterium]|nr:hypothetical protein [Planctomycetota bacterium]
MVRGCRLGALAALLLGLSAGAFAEDKDKARLFNTFFLEGDSVTWYLVFRADRSFEIISPDGRKATGQFVASDKEIYIAGRHFQYKFQSSDVTFTPTEKDGAGAGILSELPPRDRSQKAKFYSAQSWQKMGRDATPPKVVAEPPKEPERQPQPPAPLPENPVIAAQVQARPVAAAKVAGGYAYADPQQREHRLSLTEGGTFEYQGPDGRKANGTYVYLNGEITLDSGFHRRHFDLAETPGGVLMTRRDTDVLKPGDPLGEMPPQERVSLTYRKRENAAPPPVVAPVPDPVTTEVKPIPPAPLPVVQPEEKPAPKPPEAVGKVPEAEKPKPPEPAANAPASLEAMAGSYVFRPNPLVTETWVLKAGGTFDYSDSNGAKVSGTAALDRGVLHLKAGEVERSFKVSVQGNLLVLTRTNEDNPKITNDLSTMSPSASPEAKYEKR